MWYIKAQEDSKTVGDVLSLQNRFTNTMSDIGNRLAKTVKFQKGDKKEMDAELEKSLNATIEHAKSELAKISEEIETHKERVRKAYEDIINGEVEVPPPTITNRDEMLNSQHSRLFGAEGVGKDLWYEIESAFKAGFRGKDADSAIAEWQKANPNAEIVSKADDSLVYKDEHGVSQAIPWDELTKEYGKDLPHWEPPASQKGPSNLVSQFKNKGMSIPQEALGNTNWGRMRSKIQIDNIEPTEKKDVYKIKYTFQGRRHEEEFTYKGELNYMEPDTE